MKTKNVHGYEVEVGDAARVYPKRLFVAALRGTVVRVTKTTFRVRLDGTAEQTFSRTTMRGWGQADACAHGYQTVLLSRKVPVEPEAES